MKAAPFAAAGLLGVGVAAVVAWKSLDATPVPPVTVTASAVAFDASVPDAASLQPDGGGPLLMLGPPDASPGTLTLTPLTTVAIDGSRQARFGVILVGYAGAQGAPASARSKADASKLATTLAGDAKTDFAAAVARGDSGSQTDAGRIERGVLEADVETALFALARGETSAPLDTPRGFWIMRRIE